MQNTENILWLRERSLKQIRKYHTSKVSATWGSGSKLGKRVLLASPSRLTAGAQRVRIYATQKDWKKAGYQ